MFFTDYVSRYCFESDISGPTEWIKPDYIFLPWYQISRITRTFKKTESPEKCVLECQDWNRNCIAVIYNRAENTCFWTSTWFWLTVYELSPVYADNDTVIFIKICGSGN